MEVINMAEQNELKVSYATTGMADKFLDLFRRVTPQKIDAKYIVDNGITTAANASTVITFGKWLGLIDKDGNVVADKVSKLRLVGDARNAYIAELVRESYKDLFDRVNLEAATRDDIANHFVNTYGLGTGAAQQAALLFIHLCQTYGIPIPEGLKKKAYTSSTQQRTPANRSPRQSQKAEVKPQEEEQISSKRNSVLLVLEGKRHEFKLGSSIDKVVFEALSKELLNTWDKQVSQETDDAEDN